MISTPALRTFGLVLAAFVAALPGLVLPLLGAYSFRPWILWMALALAAVALAAPRALRPVHAGWMLLGRALGWLNTRLLLGIVFFGVLWPTAIFRRLLGARGMPIAYDPSARTYRVTREGQGSPDDFDKPY